MSFKMKSFLVSWIMMSIVYSVVLVFVSRANYGLGRLFPDGPSRIPICLGTAVGVSFVISLIIILTDKNVRGQAESRTELEKNGYSDRYLSILESEVNRLKGKNISQYYIECVVLLSNQYAYRDRLEDAINTISLLNPKGLMDHAGANLVSRLNLFRYFDVQMGICEQLKDPSRANNVLQDVRPFIDKYYHKEQTADITIDEILFMYDMTVGNYNGAMRRADEFLNRNKKSETLNSMGYYMKARVYRYLGDKKNAVKFINEASSIVKGKSLLDIINKERGEIEALQDVAVMPETAGNFGVSNAPVMSETAVVPEVSDAPVMPETEVVPEVSDEPVMPESAGSFEESNVPREV